VGYASIHTFSRGFREAKKVTPSAWREAELRAVGMEGDARTGE
jgi:AraC-like DNA-binding protein